MDPGGSQRSRAEGFVGLIGWVVVGGNRGDWVLMGTGGGEGAGEGPKDNRASRATWICNGYPLPNKGKDGGGGGGGVC